MALRWRIGGGRRLLRFGAAAGTSVALLLSAGCHGGGGSSDRADGDGAGADADAVAEEPEGVEPESASPSAIRPVDPLVTAAVRSYEAYLQAQARALPARARGFTDAVRRGDVAAARKNFAASRVGWERIQSVGVLLPRLDRSIDARADDFATPSDRAWTGWHRLEQLLWTARGTAGATPYADRLDRDLQQLSRAVPGLVITAPIMTTGIQRLVEEAIAEKLPGLEDRYARTDLADLAANIEGAHAGYAFARSVLTVRDPALARRIDGQFAAVGRTIAKYRGPGGYRPYPALSPGDKATLQAELTTLAETLTDLPSTVR